jgi:hypothetical protein
LYVEQGRVMCCQPYALQPGELEPSGGSQRRHDSLMYTIPDHLAVVGEKHFEQEPNCCYLTPTCRFCEHGVGRSLFNPRSPRCDSCRPRDLHAAKTTKRMRRRSKPLLQPSWSICRKAARPACEETCDHCMTIDPVSRALAIAFRIAPLSQASPVRFRHTRASRNRSVPAPPIETWD